MKIYLVGGALRDSLLDRPIQERDWVVVGASPQEMLAQGFIQVGKSFPVFLEPKTKEEYALARTEKKIGKGYYGFECNFSKEVTLEEDLKRRDLTINAMAIDRQYIDNNNVITDITMHLIDPYNGYSDLLAKQLRHVSDAFSEDPVRLLRVARFLARFGHLGFEVAPQTLVLMQDMVIEGEIDALVPERVWQEFESALKETTPVLFIQLLKQTGALSKLCPELDILYGIPQKAIYHPEVDTGVHMEMVLTKITQLSSDPVVRFAALVHDLGKGATPKEEWPSHKGHEERGVPLIEAMCSRLKIPSAYKELAVIVSRYHLQCHRIFELKPSTILKVLQGVDAFRRPERFKNFLLVCQADAQGRLGLEDKAYPQRAYFWGALKAALAVDIAAVIQSLSHVSQTLTDTNISKAERLKMLISQARIKAIKQYCDLHGTIPPISSN